MKKFVIMLVSLIVIAGGFSLFLLFHLNKSNPQEKAIETEEDTQIDGEESYDLAHEIEQKKAIDKYDSIKKTIKIPSENIQIIKMYDNCVCAVSNIGSNDEMERFIQIDCKDNTQYIIYKTRQNEYYLQSNNDLSYSRLVYKTKINEDISLFDDFTKLLNLELDVIQDGLLDGYDDELVCNAHIDGKNVTVRVGINPEDKSIRWVNFLDEFEGDISAYYSSDTDKFDIGGVDVLNEDNLYYGEGVYSKNTIHFNPVTKDYLIDTIMTDEAIEIDSDIFISVLNGCIEHAMSGVSEEETIE